MERELVQSGRLNSAILRPQASLLTWLRLNFLIYNIILLWFAEIIIWGKYITPKLLFQLLKQLSPLSFYGNRDMALQRPPLMSSKSKKGKTFSGSGLKPDPPVFNIVIIVRKGWERRESWEREKGMIFKGDQSSFSPFDLYKEKQRDYKSSQRNQVSLYSSWKNKIKRENGKLGSGRWRKAQA